MQTFVFLCNASSNCDEYSIDTCFISYFRISLFPLLYPATFFSPLLGRVSLSPSIMHRWYNGNAINCSRMHIWCLEHGNWIHFAQTAKAGVSQFHTCQKLFATGCIFNTFLFMSVMYAEHMNFTEANSFTTILFRIYILTEHCIAIIIAGSKCSSASPATRFMDEKFGVGFPFG